MDDGLGAQVAEPAHDGVPVGQVQLVDVEEDGLGDPRPQRAAELAAAARHDQAGMVLHSSLGFFMSRSDRMGSTIRQGAARMGSSHATPNSSVAS